MIHKIKYKINRIKYYFKLLQWAREHSERVRNYKFLVELRDQCQSNLLAAERGKRTSEMNKAQAQYELLNKILNNVTI